MSIELNKELETLLGAYCEEAPEEKEYPYKVFSAKRLSESEGIQTYNLEVNVWDQHKYYSRAESIMDALERELHRCNQLSDRFLIRVFKGRRENVPDPDKSIKRVREEFELRVFEREE